MKNYLFYVCFRFDFGKIREYYIDFLFFGVFVNDLFVVKVELDNFVLFFGEIEEFFVRFDGLVRVRVFDI